MERKYHPDLPDHPLIWIGSRVALSTGYGSRDHWRMAKVDRYTKTQVVLVEERGGREDRWSASSLAWTRRADSWPTWHKGGGGRGEPSTVLCAADDPQVLGAWMRETVASARDKVDRLLKMTTPDRGFAHKQPIEDYRSALTESLATLAVAKERFERLADRLPEDVKGI
jgi:hypothetical protein